MSGMQEAAQYLLEFLGVLAFLLVAGYLLPAGLFHWITLADPAPSIREARIQVRRPTAESIRREVVHSLVSVVLFSIYSLILLQAYKSGHTAITWDVAAYPWWWGPASFLLVMILHDTYFYWTHRLMHTRWLYRLCHAGHHRSVTPTPWAILSFQPLETVFQFAFFALVILLVPMHPGVLLAYFLYDGIVNAAGHCGHELVPASVRGHWLMKYMNAVTHHDVHHSRFNYNFSQYFNIWDRIMGTFLDRDPAAGRVASGAESGPAQSPFKKASMPAK